MRKLLLAASVAIMAFGAAGAVGTASADSITLGVNIGPHHRHHNHYWYHNRWYDARPVGYVYVAPPYPYEDPYWRAHWRRTHHCRDYDGDGDCH